jgi:cation/acetate symporter
MGKIADGSGLYLLDRLNGLNEALGFDRYTDGSKSTIDVFFITAALMLGTAGLPHVIIRFYTVRKASEARISAGWALLFIALLYTTAPAVAIFARTNLLNTVTSEQDGELIDVQYENVPEWFKNWEMTGRN